MPGILLSDTQYKIQHLVFASVSFTHGREMKQTGKINDPRLVQLTVTEQVNLPAGRTVVPVQA